MFVDLRIHDSIPNLASSFDKLYNYASKISIRTTVMSRIFSVCYYFSDRMGVKY